MFSSAPHPEQQAPTSDQAELRKAFLSLRKALKICSFGLVLLAFFQMPRALLAVSRADALWADTMGGRPKPSLFELCVRISENSMLVGSIFLLMIATCLVVTVRSRGGKFLYINLGVFILVGVFNAFLMDIAMEMMMFPLKGLAE